MLEGASVWYVIRTVTPIASRDEMEAMSFISLVERNWPGRDHAGRVRQYPSTSRRLFDRYP